MNLKPVPAEDDSQEQEKQWKRNKFSIGKP